MRKGISPLISMVLTIMFGIIMLTLVLAVVNPTLDRAKDSAVVTETFQNLPLIDSAIKEVASEAQGSKRTITISVSTGRYIVNSTKDFIALEFTPSYPMSLSGTRGSIKIEEGLYFFDYFNGYGTTSDASAEWTTLNGTWTLDSYKFKGTGVSYKHISKLQNYKFSASITNVSGTGGQVYISPVHPGYLVGFWAFDNRTGAKAYDYSGHNNNGTLTNMNTQGNATSGWQDAGNCKAGLSCLKFDGINDLVLVNYTSAFAFTNQVTVDAWVYLPTGWDATKPNTNMIVKFQDDSHGFSLYFSSDTGKAGFWIYDTDWRVTSTSKSNWGAGWYHLAGVYDGSEVKIYVNGVQDGTPTAASGNINNVAQNLSIGYSYYQSQYPFNGTIDEVKIWNKALTASEIQAEYELSAKKIEASSGSQRISANTNATIVLVNPDGESRFDDIVLTKEGDTKETFFIPYTSVDINSTKSFGQGEHQITIEHKGVNSTTNRPIIQIT